MTTPDPDIATYRAAYLSTLQGQIAEQSVPDNDKEKKSDK